MLYFTLPPPLTMAFSCLRACVRACVFLPPNAFAVLKGTQQMAGDPAEASFEWTRQWYPVAVMRDLEARDPRQPYPVQVGWVKIVSRFARNL